MQDALGVGFIWCLFVHDIEQMCKMQWVSLSNGPGGKFALRPIVYDIEHICKMHLVSLSNSLGGKLAAVPTA